jgi:hypothetical protein
MTVNTSVDYHERAAQAQRWCLPLGIAKTTPTNHRVVSAGLILSIPQSEPLWLVHWIELARGMVQYL